MVMSVICSVQNINVLNITTFKYRYSFLNKIWRPVHKICFVQKRAHMPGVQAMPHMHGPVVQEKDPALHELITCLSVTDRPDMMIFRKFSEASSKRSAMAMRKKVKDSSKAGKDEDSLAVSIATLHSAGFPNIKKSI